MSLSLFFLFFILLTSFFKNFSKKVSMLLTLEGMMLLLIFFIGSLWSHSVLCCFFTLLVSIFMVLDSVLGMSLLIISVRNSNFNYNEFSTL